MCPGEVRGKHHFMADKDYVTIRNPLQFYLIVGNFNGQLNNLFVQENNCHQNRSDVFSTRFQHKNYN
jgi:hypothetical protein